MRKRALAWIVLAAILVFSWSCAIYSWKERPLQSIKSEKRERVRISAVQTKSGEKIDFNKNPVARIRADSVVGEKFFKDIAIEKSKIKKPKNLPFDTPFLLTTTDGNSYRVTFWADVKDRIVLYAYVPFSVPLLDVDLVWTRKLNVPATLLVNVGIPLVITSFLLALLYPGFE